MSASPSTERQAIVSSPPLDFRLFFEAAPGALIVVLPDDPAFTVVAVNDAYLKVSGARRDDLLGSGLFQSFPDNPELGENGSQAVRSSLRRAIATRAPDRINQRYDVKVVGAAGEEFQERHWSALNTPLVGADGRIAYLLQAVEEITEKVLAERREDITARALQAIQTRLSATLFFAQLGTFEWDLRTDVVALDERSRAIFGFEEGQGTRAQEIFDRIDPADFDRVLAEAKASRQERSRLEIEYSIRLPDGSVRNILSVSGFALGPSGPAERVFGVFSDITNRKREHARQAFLLELSDRLRSLADPQAAIAASVHLLGRHLRASRVGYGQVQPDDRTILLQTSYVDGVAPIVGTYPLDAFGAEANALQRQGRTVVHNDVRANPSNNLAAWDAIETRSFVSVPLIRDGRYRAGFFVNQREVRAWLPEEVSLIEEVAARTWEAVERARAEISLSRSEAKYRSLFESMDEGFCLVHVLFDSQGNAYDYRFLEINPAFYKDTGLPHAIGRTIRELVPGHETHWFETYGKVALTGEPARFENQAQAMGRFYDVYAFRVGEPDLHQVAILFSDISERKQAEQELRHSHRELEEFAYVASHDLQEPLRMVNIYTQLIVKDLAGDRRTLEGYAGFVQQGVKRMDGLIRDLLKYSRVIHKEQAPVETADLSVALQDAVAVLDSRIAETAAAITAPILPAVRGETKQMGQVFQNLLSNALKYRLPEVPPEICISAERDGTHWVISVRDNGIGFEPQYAERIFGLFKRLHKDEYPGTGLGLAICQRIIERYGGRLWAEGRPGNGATFFFALPAAGPD